ncbi:MAG: hypothetical protein K0R71_1501 [Bacillales bacterium]|jgi:hypothetical protein|nr:hypothetical protein [Bacillales bacterium]
MDDEPGETLSIKYVVCEFRKTKHRLIKIITSFYHRSP